MLINEVAKKYKVSVRTIRYYDELGLIKSSRSQANIRAYDDSALELLEEILVYKALNISLADIKVILSADNKKFLRNTLFKELTKIDQKIVDLKYKQQLIRSTINTFASDDFTKDNIKSFIEEQLYFKASDERWLNMVKSNITIDIGEALIPLAVDESTCSLFDAIKRLRVELKTTYGVTLDKVRLKDDPKLKANEFKITSNDEVIVKKDLISENPQAKVDQIITHLKALML